MLIEDAPSVALYDSGANITLVTSPFLKALGKKIPFSTSYTFNTISGIGKIEGVVELNIQIFNTCKKIKCFVIEKESSDFDLILGLDSIKKFRLRQDENLNISQNNNIISQVNPDKTNIRPEVQSHAGIPVSELYLKLNHLNNTKQKKLYQILKTYNTVFAKDRYDVGKIKDYTACIKLTENKYTYKKPYRCSLPDQQLIDEQVSELLIRGLIEPSSSPFAAPVTLAYKRGKKKK